MNNCLLQSCSGVCDRGNRPALVALDIRPLANLVCGGFGRELGTKIATGVRIVLFVGVFVLGGAIISDVRLDAAQVAATIEQSDSDSSVQSNPAAAAVEQPPEPNSKSNKSQAVETTAASTTEVAPVSEPRPLSKILFEGDAPQSIAELREMEQQVAKIYEQVKPAVVNIQVGAGQGSGVVVSEDGYVLTAAHVIASPGESATIVFPDGKKFKATTLGLEHRIDSGLLKIDEDQGGEFPYAPMGLSSVLKPGQWVMAIGHPGGLDEDRGLVVRVGRLMLTSKRVLRTDCTLVGGDSGGPLVDLNGEVVGIHSRIGAQLWNNLHVPIDTYSENWDRLAAGIVLDGRPNLGFSVIEKTNEVESMVEGGAAETAGMKVGDRVITVDGIETEDREDISEAIVDLRPNMKTKIVVERDGKQETLELVVGQR